MKRLACLLLALSLLLALFGCTTPSAPPTDPSNTTHGEMTEGSEATAPVEMNRNENEVPLMLGIEQKDRHVQMNVLTWNLEEGTLSEPAPWIDITCSSFLDVLLDHWDGGSTVFLPADAEPVKEEVQIMNELPYRVPFGRCIYVNAEDKLYQIGPADSRKEFPLPRDPGEVYDAEKLPMEPHYATIDGDNGIVAFFVYEGVYDKTTMEGDVVYCTYPLANPEQAVWKSVHIPLEYAMDAFVQFNGAYHDGTLYLASFRAILAIDVESGELQVLDATNAFAPVWAMHPGATQTEDGYEEPVMISGCWKGILVASFPLSLPDGGYYHCFVALRDGEPVAIMERQANGILTLYDGDGKLLGTTDRFQDKIAALSVQFPRDD